MVKLPVEDRITVVAVASDKSNRRLRPPNNPPSVVGYWHTIRVYSPEASQRFLGGLRLDKLSATLITLCFAVISVAMLPAAGSITSALLNFDLSTYAEATPLVGQTPRNRPRSPRPPGKSLSRGGSSSSVQAEDPFRFDLDSAVEVLSDSTEIDLYDPLTLATLKRLKADATPPYDPYDIDPVRTRHVVEKALAIQAGKTMANLLRTSDLRDFHRLVLKNLDFLQGLLTFSVSRGHDGLNAGHTPDGESLFAFNLRMSVRDGFDPQIRLSDSLRFRYDLGERQTLLEYGIGF
jgi:hypothetical protein